MLVIVLVNVAKNELLSGRLEATVCDGASTSNLVHGAVLLLLTEPAAIVLIGGTHLSCGLLASLKIGSTCATAGL